MNIAAILAGGSGKRLGGDIPKQFLPLAGKPLIEYSLEAFQQHNAIDEIVLVVPFDFIAKCEIFKYMFPKISAVIQGGEERHLSTLAVLNHYSEKEDDTLILHDAARPMLDQRMISDTIEKMQTYRAATVVVKTTDTIIQSNNKQYISGIFNRSTMFNVQTPQAFKFSVLRKAFQLAIQDKAFQVTDDSAVVFTYLPDEKIAIVEGSLLNIKLTYLEDFSFLEKHIQSSL